MSETNFTAKKVSSSADARLTCVEETSNPHICSVICATFLVETPWTDLVKKLFIIDCKPFIDKEFDQISVDFENGHFVWVKRFNFLMKAPDAAADLLLGLLWLPGLEFIDKLVPIQKYITLGRLLLTIPCIYMGVKSGNWGW